MKHSNSSDFAETCIAIKGISGSAGFKAIIAQLNTDKSYLTASSVPIEDLNYGLKCAKRDGKIEAITELLNALERALKFEPEEETPPTEA